MGSVVSVTPWPLYTWRNIPQHPLDRRLSGPQSRSGHFEEENNISTRNRTPTLQPVAHSYIIIIIIIIINFVTYEAKADKITNFTIRRNYWGFGICQSYGILET
jgi:hypothetical protein